MTRSEVLMTSDAQADLEDILSYIEIHDSREKADYVYSQIKKKIFALQSFPNRGRVVPELKEIGVHEFREIFFKPYRIIYFAQVRKVLVIAIFDGRRDLDDVLRRRFLP